MKTMFNHRSPKTLTLLLVVALLFAIGLSSCKKDTNGTTLSYLNVINAAETSAPQDFYLDNTKVNTAALAYTQSTGYVTVSGAHNAQFRTSATGTVNVAFTASFAPGTTYTLFYNDDQTFAGSDNDRITPTLPGKARVRFINLSTAVNSNVDIGVTGGSTLASALAYKTFSIYYDVDPASIYTLKATGSGTILLNLPATIQSGGIYTIYISGATAATVSYHVLTEM
jgi:hypothetical protein